MEITSESTHDCKGEALCIKGKWKVNTKKVTCVEKQTEPSCPNLPPSHTGGEWQCATDPINGCDAYNFVAHVDFDCTDAFTQCIGVNEWSKYKKPKCKVIKTCDPNGPPGPSGGVWTCSGAQCVLNAESGFTCTGGDDIAICDTKKGMWKYNKKLKCTKPVSCSVSDLVSPHINGQWTCNEELTNCALTSKNDDYTCDGVAVCHAKKGVWQIKPKKAGCREMCDAAGPPAVENGTWWCDESRSSCQLDCEPGYAVKNPLAVCNTKKSQWKAKGKCEFVGNL